MYDINELLVALAENEGASDLYVTVASVPLLKIKGSMVPQGEVPLTDEDTRRMAEELMNEREKTLFAENLEMNLAYTIPEKGRYRVNIFRQMNYVGMVVRIIPLNFPTFEELGLPEVCARLCMQKRGMILIVGATGSGKSTTLAAMLDYRNKNQDGHIITIEDPVEFVHTHHKSIVTHREVGSDTHAFHDALKNALRQAPDVILIGEIRDTDTMEAAITFAETGHLVFGTLHANNSNQTLQRIMNFFPAERHKQLYMQLSLNIRAIISQRLMKRADGTGRVAVQEIMMNTPRIADLILKGEVDQIKESMALSGQYGGQTFDQSLVKYYDEEIITEEMAIAESDSANDVKILIDQLKTQRKMLEEKTIIQVVDFDVSSRTEEVKHFELSSEFCIGTLHAGLEATHAYDMRRPAALLDEDEEMDAQEQLLLRIKPHPDVSIHCTVTSAALRHRDREGGRDFQFELGIGVRALDADGTVLYQHQLKDVTREKQKIRNGQVVEGMKPDAIPDVWKTLGEKLCYGAAKHMAANFVPEKRAPAAS